MPESITVDYDFCQGTHGWEGGFAAYHKEMEMQLEAGPRLLSPELDSDGTGFYLQEMNRSDDLFRYLKRGLTTDDDIVPGQE